MTEVSEEYIKLHEVHLIVNIIKFMTLIVKYIKCMMLRTTTPTFLVPKNILNAESSESKRMLCTDMKEANDKSVHVTGADSEPLCRLLLYIYADTVELKGGLCASIV
ncbi:hypothetical protein AVEN_183748-1 [Araneus ventricosus]|uniref:Uncharacterized protein n=1 Tax=Araneus ventricosus TaxID=182803 RepID=A0A4Y2S6H8_ARAVE|nr:hypothetical protein AVEN_183748-1 [Araneus ventricosus]